MTTVCFSPFPYVDMCNTDLVQEFSQMHVHTLAFNILSVLGGGLNKFFQLKVLPSLVAHRAHMVRAPKFLYPIANEGMA